MSGLLPEDVSLAVPDIALGLALLTAAGCALIPRSRLALAAGFLSLGALTALVWLRLDSVDVGLAEAGLGGGILGALLVWLAIRSPHSPAPDSAETISTTQPTSGTRRTSRPILNPRTLLGCAAGAVLGGGLCLVWFQVLHALPAWSEPLEEQMETTGVTHEITGVLLAFRAYDTLLESAVLMLAGVAVMALGRDGGLHQLSLPQPEVPSALRWLVRLCAPVLLLAGLWLLFAGSSDSGGAFQSGAVLCSLLILLRTAHALPSRERTEPWIRPLLIGGVVVFILAGLVGPLLADPLLSEAWLSWQPQWATAAVLSVEILLTIGIAVGLFLMYLTLENPEGVQ
ncbi:MnhB domain-containing protein [Nesterenkonia cremea]|uniref:DUF4040 domain-containing protein n=1 Tax=Nesterenkonia cremea TaxID=1882340 RepID=A0A917AM53_9MICC|nr:MnhB domain-containing protein [Nesterenkonia cremea]GGE58120.1 hypothetical protein GCM10011401_01110 [Nesterenkonia cremea]